MSGASGFGSRVSGLGAGDLGSEGGRPQFSFDNPYKVEDAEGFRITYRLPEGGGDGEAAAREALWDE